MRLTLKELFCNKFYLSYSKLVVLKILAFVFLFISCDTVANAQVINGTVLDKDTKSPIGYAYPGSRMHFFRALWYNDLKSTGFSIKNISNKDLSYKDIVYQDASNNKYLMHGENLYIYYYSKEPLSTLEFLKEKVYFANDRYFDPSGIAWDGKMANLRIADRLPYEFSRRELSLVC